MPHICNPSYLGSWDQDCGSWLSWENILRDPYPKRTRGMAQAVELSKLQVGSPEFKPQYTKKKKNIYLLNALIIERIDDLYLV
jgi:hypothetical protein